MKLYFQFLTQNQSVGSVEILTLLSILTDGQEVDGRVNVHAQATISRSSFSAIDTLIGKLANKRFNTLEIIPTSSRLCFGGSRSHIESIDIVFSPSPTSALWLPTGDWRIDANKVSRNKYMTAKQSEQVIAFHKIRRQPSILTLLLEIATNASQEAILDMASDQLANNLPSSLDKLQLFGCCDVAEPVFIPQLKRSVLMPERFQVLMKVKPPAYPELGDRFEALHPLMFGAKHICKGIKASLGKDARLRTAKHAKRFALIRLTNGSKESTKRRMGDWLISGTDKLT